MLAQFLAVSVHVYSLHESVRSLPYFLGIFLIFFDVSPEDRTVRLSNKATQTYKSLRIINLHPPGAFNNRGLYNRCNGNTVAGG
jgi:hypothetical protein